MDAVKEYLAKIGRKGGKSRVKNQTDKERRESARRAAQARWAKHEQQIEENFVEIQANLEKLRKPRSKKATIRP